MRRIILIGCGKTKRDGRHPAADLYCGSLYRQRLAYAMREIARSPGTEYAILSARHGLVRPDVLLDRYEHTMGMWSCLDRIAWMVGVVRQLCEHIDNDLLDWSDIRAIHLEIHAGADYADPLAKVLREVGFAASWPVEGLSQGHQMRWYADRLGPVVTGDVA